MRLTLQLLTSRHLLIGGADVSAGRPVYGELALTLVGSST